MANHWDRYISRLKSRRSNDPAYASIRRATAAMAEPTMAVNRQIQGNLAMSGASVGAKAEMQQQGVRQIANAQQQVIQSIPRQDNSALDDQIFQAETQRDAERDQQKNAGLKTALTVGGTALGAIAGSVIAPGAGTMLGAQVGSGLGGTASGFVGGGGQMGWDYANPQEIIQGVADTVEGVSSAVSLKNQKQLATDFGNAYGNMTLDDKETAKLAILTNNTDLLKTVISRSIKAPFEAQINGYGGEDLSKLTPDELELQKLWAKNGVTP